MTSILQQLGVGNFEYFIGNRTRKVTPKKRLPQLSELRYFSIKAITLCYQIIQTLRDFFLTQATLLSGYIRFAIYMLMIFASIM